MSTLQQIQQWADAGWNQEDVAQALGLSRYKLRLFLRQHPEYHWPKGRSIAQKERARTWKPIGNPNNVERLNKARHASLKRYTVQGITGTRRELTAALGVVPAHTVDVRIARGWPLEAALLTPARSKPSETHVWREPMPEAV